MVRGLRIGTGLVLFIFVTLHLINVSLGLVSLEAMEAGRPYFMEMWSNPVGGNILIVSMVVHMALGLAAVYWRNTLRLAPYDAVQLVSALLIVPLMAAHILGVTLVSSVFDTNTTFRSILLFFWVYEPLSGLMQVLGLAAVWIHGCIGVFAWLRLKAWWGRFTIVAYPLAVAIPVMALLGFVNAGNDVIAAANAEISPATYEEEQADAYAGTETGDTAQPQAYEYAASSDDEAAAVEDEQPAQSDIMTFYNQVRWGAFGIYLLILAGVFGARAVRLMSSGKDMVELRYKKGPVVKARAGLSLLETARLNDLPHANICRGRGRCGTCRVHIISSTAELPPVGEIERKTLTRFNMPEGTRLACQIVPGAGVIELERLLAPDIRAEDIGKDKSLLYGEADEVAEAGSAEAAQ